MTDISKEAVERLANRVGDILHNEYEGNLPVGNIPPHEMEDIETMLRAQRARIDRLEGGLRKIGRQKPDFDYVEVRLGESLDPNNMRPGSPFDRGLDAAYKKLTKMARDTLRQPKDTSHDT